MDYVRTWAEKTELPQARLIAWLGVGRSKFFDWRTRFGKVNEHNAWVPRDHWLLPEEKQVIRDYHAKYPREGYRRLAIMMLDADLVAVSPASVMATTRSVVATGFRMNGSEIFIDHSAGSGPVLTRIRSAFRCGENRVARRSNQM